MRVGIKSLVIALLLGLVVVDAATAQRRRKQKRQEARTEETRKQPTDLSTVEDAELVAALELFVYPAGGQSAEQQTADQVECAGWARQQIGEMPASPAEGAQAEEASRREERRQGDRSALKGAAKGAVIGEALEDDQPDLPKRKDLEDLEAPESRDDIGDNVKRARKDDDPSAAEVGAVAGAVAGRRRGKKAEAKADARAAEAQAAGAEQAEHDDLRKALKACLEGKGYEVE